MQTIHFKVAAQNSIRRFVIVDPTYIAVRRLVASLFGLAVDDSWVLQYKDEEKQLITFSSDEELKFAYESNEKLLHLQVVLNDCDVHVTKKDKRDKEPRKERGARKPRSADFLTKKQERLRTRISSLGTQDSAKAKSQVEKLEKKLAEVTAELEQLSRVIPANDSNSSNVPATPPVDIISAPAQPQETKDIVPADAPETPVGLPTNQLSVFNKQLLKDVSSKFFSMRREIHQERMRILSLRKVLKALQILSRHGSRSDCSVQISDEQVDQMKASLVVATEEFSAKKKEVRNQAQLLHVLERQQRKFLIFKKKEKRQRRGRNSGKSDKSDKPKRTWRREKRALSDDLTDGNSESWKEKRMWRKEKRALSDDLSDGNSKSWKERRDENRALRRDRKEKREKNFDKEKRTWKKAAKENNRGMRRRRSDSDSSDSDRSEKSEF